MKTIVIADDGAGRRNRAADPAVGLGIAAGVAAPLDNSGRGGVGFEEQITNSGAIVTRASQQVRREAERQFPVRVRIAVPSAGLGRQLELMQAWLDEVCGVAGWSSAPAGTAGVVNDAVAFYFESAAFAHAFVARFCCGYRVETIAGSFAARRDEPAPRRDASAHKTP
jgi:hypothetical protein